MDLIPRSEHEPRVLPAHQDFAPDFDFQLDILTEKYGPANAPLKHVAASGRRRFDRNLQILGPDDDGIARGDLPVAFGIHEHRSDVGLDRDHPRYGLRRWPYDRKQVCPP